MGDLHFLLLLFYNMGTMHCIWIEREIIFGREKKKKDYMKTTTPDSKEGAQSPYAAIRYIFVSVPRCQKTIGVTDWI